MTVALSRESGLGKEELCLENLGWNLQSNVQLWEYHTPSSKQNKVSGWGHRYHFQLGSNSL